MISSLGKRIYITDNSIQRGSESQREETEDKWDYKTASGICYLQIGSRGSSGSSA